MPLQIVVTSFLEHHRTSWIRALIGFGGLQSINLCFALSFTLWKMGTVSWMLTGITLAPIVIGTVIVQGAIRSWYPMMKLNQEKLAEISEHVWSPFKCHDHSGISGSTGIHTCIG